MQIISDFWKKISVEPSQKKPWKPFLVKAATVGAITVTCVAVSLSAFSSRFEIVIDPQMMKCLPDYTVYLIDRNDKTPVKGEPFAFEAEGISAYLDKDDKRLDEVRSYYEDGKKLLKIVDGMPGDNINVTSNGVLVNGIIEGVPGLVHAKLLKKEESDFEKTYVLGHDKYFFAGRTFDSFDSRYWGEVDGGRIIGRAYPLF